MSLSRTLVYSVIASADPLQNVKMTSGHLGDLFAVYAASGSVKGIGIRGYNVTLGSSCELAMALRNLDRRLGLLDLSCSDLGNHGAINILSGLAETTGEVHELSFRLCHLTPEFAELASKVLFQHNARRTSGLIVGTRPFGALRALDISFNVLGCAGVGAILKCCPSGIQLDASYTALHQDADVALTQLESGLKSTEASSVILFGAGEMVTDHFQRHRKLTQAQKERQQDLDGVLLETLDDVADLRVTGGVPNSSAQPKLQFCRFGAPSLTLFLDGDIEAPPTEDFINTQQYLQSKDPAREPLTEGLLREVVTVTGEPLFVTPKYKPGRRYPPFVRGEIAGVNRVRDGRPSTSVMFSARSASGLVVPGSAMTDAGGEPTSRSASAAMHAAASSRTATPAAALFTGSGNNNNTERSASARQVLFTNADDEDYEENGNNNNNNDNDTAADAMMMQNDPYATSRSNSAISYQKRSGSAYGRERSAVSYYYDREHDRSASALSNGEATQPANTTNGGGGVASATYQSRSGSAISQLGGGGTQQQRSGSTLQQQQQPADSRSGSAVATTAMTTSRRSITKTPFMRDAAPVLNTAAAPNRPVIGGDSHSNTASPLQPNVSPLSTRSDRGSASSLLIPTHNDKGNVSVTMAASHLSPRSVVGRGRVLAAFVGTQTVCIRDLTREKRIAHLRRLLQVCPVSDHTSERVFGFPVKQYLGPNCPLPPTVQDGIDDTSFPAVLRAANGTPSCLIRQAPGSEKRVTGIAKIMFLLVTCELPEVGAQWLAEPTLDLPEFMRSFGAHQPTVRTFRGQRAREDLAARSIVQNFLESDEL